jgi:Transglutaminase-like superfamily
MPQQQILDFYARPAAMTSAGKYTALLGRLPDDLGTLVRIVQGLAIHEFAASSFYGVALPDDRKNESHIRPVEQMLDRIVAMDDSPLTVARPPERRLVGVCRHFMVLLLALLRAKGVPARGRCGFGTYFNPGFFEDHVVCEYWNAAEQRWVLVDPQFDDVWRAKLKIDHNVLDVPRDRFVIAAGAWTQCRSGNADPTKFGIVKGDLRGLWFIAANLVHEVVLLNKIELLRWDAWGAIPRPDERLQDHQLAFFDELATLTRQPDNSFEELRRLYQCDDRLRVPATVFNSLLSQPEPVSL